MAARANPSQGSKPDKLMRDALMLELNREVEDTDGKKIRQFRRIAAKTVEMAAEGKMDAISLIFDRSDGKLATPSPANLNIGLKVDFVVQNGPTVYCETIDASPMQITGIEQE